MVYEHTHPHSLAVPSFPGTSIYVLPSLMLILQPPCPPSHSAPSDAVILHATGSWATDWEWRWELTPQIELRMQISLGVSVLFHFHAILFFFFFLAKPFGARWTGEVGRLAWPACPEMDTATICGNYMCYPAQIFVVRLDNWLSVITFRGSFCLSSLMAYT